MDHDRAIIYDGDGDQEDAAFEATIAFLDDHSHCDQDTGEHSFKCLLEGKAPLLSCQQVIVNLRRQLENTQSDFDNEALYNTNEHTQQRQEILKLALEIGKLNSTIAELKRQNQIFIDTMGILVQRK